LHVNTLGNAWPLPVVTRVQPVAWTLHPLRVPFAIRADPRMSPTWISKAP